MDSDGDNDGSGAKGAGRARSGNFMQEVMQTLNQLGLAQTQGVNQAGAASANGGLVSATA